MSERDAIESNRPIGGPDWVRMHSRFRFFPAFSGLAEGRVRPFGGLGIWVLGFAAKRLFSPGTPDVHS
jgi:hypothetical protein